MLSIILENHDELKAFALEILGTVQGENLPKSQRDILWYIGFSDDDISPSDDIALTQIASTLRELAS